MIKRLWFAFSLLWAAFWALLYLAGDRKADSAIVWGVILAPYVAGYIILRAARFVVRGE